MPDELDEFIALYAALSLRAEQARVDGPPKKSWAQRYNEAVALYLDEQEHPDQHPQTCCPRANVALVIDDSGRYHWVCPIHLLEWFGNSSLSRPFRGLI